MSDNREAELSLHRAIRGYQVIEVKHLLKEGVNPNALDDPSGNFAYAFTALCAAIAAAGHAAVPISREMMRALRELDPNVSERNRKAERASSLEILRLLLGFGADPN